MNNFIPQLNKKQLKILERRQRQEDLHKLSKQDPSALIIVIKNYPYIVSEYGNEYDDAFTSAWEFIKWRLDELKSLDKLAHEMGYSSDELLDFMEDLLEYDSEENLEQLLIDRYDAENMETWINGKK
ncbi:hypothetical protein HMPREF9218_0137 [Lactobacillus iners LEAF 2062A-h1]|uniref:hypothetical protein n=1 Tax=Lactobacillus iners TaxID=147802 RepID=UPI0001E9C080|nr:hypothetical protein [Lactobacillus iners]EFQ50583.1 hypothetical protein HMPREF9218_0137 [Lactobacillus iners LEAF 2062A-h1]MYM99656.1 hypothetical protein [Lactobacillus iners]